MILQKKANHTVYDNINFWHLILLLIHIHLSARYFNGIKRDYEELDPAEVSESTESTESSEE